MTEIKDRVLRTERLEWRNLKPFQPDNLKTMSKESFEILKNSILKKDFIASFKVWQENDDYWILDGHHRKYALDALEKAGHQVPDRFNCEIIDCKDRKGANDILLTYSSSHAYLDSQGLTEFIHVNELDWDELKQTLDLPSIDLDKLQNDNVEVLEPQCDEDETPELAIEATTKLGDIWILGNHRLICGDSTNTDSLSKMLMDDKADMVFTDPPYNANYSSRVDKDRRKPWGGIMNDNMSDEAFDTFLSETMNSLTCFVKDGASVYCCIDWKHSAQVEKEFRKAFKHKASIIWDKKHFGLGTYYRTQYEIILFGVFGEKLSTWNAASNERDVWSLSRDPVNEYVHPTQKPVELVERAINNSSQPDNIILDIFSGSGTTLIACEKAGRKARVSELSPSYCDVQIKRWQKYTGKQATHADTGRTFNDLSPLV